jgi:hypothetical protein
MSNTLLELNNLLNVNDRKEYIDTLAFADLIRLLNESATNLKEIYVYDYVTLKLLEIYRGHVKSGLFECIMTLYSEVAERIIFKAILWEQKK